MDSSKLEDLFFSELKQYNSTNFKTLLNAHIESEDPRVHKACSSVVTRYFIFSEKHPEIDEQDLRMLYFMLKIDMIARYFSEYPASKIENLQPFQDELKRYVERNKPKNTEAKKQEKVIEQMSLDQELAVV